MTFNEAVDIVRDAYSKNFIFGGYEYKNIYVFRLSMDSKRIDGDMCTFSISVDKNTKKIELFNEYKETFNNPDILNAKKKIYM